MLKAIGLSPDNTLTLESDLGSEETGFTDAHLELGGLEAKQLALREATSRGVPNPSLTLGTLSPYPVDAQGQLIADSDPKGRRIHRYRIDSRLSSGA